MWESWLDSVEVLFQAETWDTSFGTTQFFSNPYDAKEFVETHMILSNPRLSDSGNPSQRQILLINSEESLALALSQTNYAPAAAVLYWQFMQDYILLNTYDDRLANVFAVGTAAAEDTLSLTYDEDVESSFKLPWWVILLPVALIFLRKK